MKLRERLTPYLLLGVFTLGTGLGIGLSSIHQVGASAATKPAKEVILWLIPTADPGQVATIKSDLFTVPSVRGCVFHTKLSDYREAKHLLSTNEYRLLTLGDTPASIRCLAASSALNGIVTGFSGRPGVMKVTVPVHPSQTPIHGS